VVLIAESGIKLRKVKPRAIVKENRIPRIISGCNLDWSVRGPKIKATRIEKAKAIQRGGRSSARPKAEPAKAACDIQKPREVSFIRTIKVPIREQTTPARQVPDKIIIRVFSGSIVKIDIFNPLWFQ